MTADKGTFLKGMENLKSIGRDEQLSLHTSVNVFLFYSFLCCVAKHQGISGKVFFINGEPEKKRKKPTKDEYRNLYARKFSSRVKEMVNEWTVVSALSRTERIRLIIQALKDSPKNGHYRGRYLEFLLLNRTFDYSKISEAASFGHYDEFTYWLTEICAEKNIKYSMFQHGIVLETIKIPNRIKCNEAHVYNQYSYRVFKNNIVCNSSCNYIIAGLPQSVQFKEIKREKGKYYVGIIDQNDDQWTSKIIEAIDGIEGCIPIVMLHPLNNKEHNGMIYTKEKYINLDVVIVNYSTLILDYLAANYSGKIICTNKEATETIFGEYGFVYADENELINKVGGKEQVKL